MSIAMEHNSDNNSTPAGVAQLSLHHHFYRHATPFGVDHSSVGGASLTYGYSHATSSR